MTSVSFSCANQGRQGRQIYRRSSAIAIFQRSKPNIPDVLVKTEDNPMPLNSQRAHEIIDRMKAQNPDPWASVSPAYDGRKLLVSNTSIPAHSAKFMANMSPKAVTDPKNTGLFIITVSLVLNVDAGSYARLVNGTSEDDVSKAFIQALQLLLRMSPILSGNGGTPHNSRSVFMPTGKRPSPSSNGMFELWKGIFQSVRPSINRLVVNVDTVAAFIYTPGLNIAEFIGRSLGIREPRDLNRLVDTSDEWRIVKTLVKRLAVEATVPPRQDGLPYRRRTIRDVIVDIGAFQFDWERPQHPTERISVKDYFVRVHHKTPVIKLGLQFGSNRRPIVVPAEYCIIASGQLLKRTLTPEQMKEMLDFTKTPPQQRLRSIQDAVNGQFLNYEQSQYVQQTGLEISKTPLEARGRMLERPVIRFKHGDPLKPQEDTSWRIMNQNFVLTRRSCWAVVNFSDARAEQVLAFARQIQLRCAARGMEVGGLVHPVLRGNNQNPHQALDEALIQYGAVTTRRPEETTPPLVTEMMILVVLPRSNRGGEQRRAVKLWGDCRKGVVTQCMKQEKAEQRIDERDQRGMKNIDQYCNNMALKINAKLGGTNSLPRSNATQMLHGGYFMVLGADVGHPGPGVTDRPSICSLTASMDADATRYISRTFIQSPRQETMDPDKLARRVYDCLLTFVKTNKFVPANLLFYRDGVSEGEFERVSEFEIPAIDLAWKKFWETQLGHMQQKNIGYIPQGELEIKLIPREREFCPPLQLTFVVVGKRHHVKFFPSQGTPTDRSGNVRGGLVVDRDIVSPTSLDFYLQSHGGLLGTSRSSHYTVLLNGVRRPDPDHPEMTVDDLQCISHYLCYAYARATRAVSIPAPVYYADLICSRARFHLNDNDQAFSDGGSGAFDQNYWNGIFREVHEEQRNRPFFM
ncbi:unnamed protein product [Peniophora sp. CBMAI 1063]|nr:unnamed protein product [Peniophora sp. CBMAI 1063]